MHLNGIASASVVVVSVDCLTNRSYEFAVVVFVAVVVVAVAVAVAVEGVGQCIEVW